MTGYRDVLFASDLSESADAAAPLAYAVAEDGGTVHLLHVLEPVFVAVSLRGLRGEHALPPPALDDPAEREREARVHLLGLVPTEHASRVRTRVHVRTTTRPARAIEEEAVRLRADCVVVGSHGRTGALRMLVGSVTADVLRTAGVPVLALRAWSTAP